MADIETATELLPLLGRDDSALDGKNRILLTKKKRERLGANFVLYLGELGCIVAQPAVIWDKMVRDVLSKDPTNLGRQQYTRLVLATAEDMMNCDEQGRVVINQRLRKDARLVDQVVITGCGDRLEIWATQEYEFYWRDPNGYNSQRRTAIIEATKQMNAESHPLEEALRRMGRG